MQFIQQMSDNELLIEEGSLYPALAVMCGLVLGLAPALQSTRADVAPALKTGRGGESPDLPAQPGDG